MLSLIVHLQCLLLAMLSQVILNFHEASLMKHLM